MSKEKKYDPLFNNNMVKSALKSLTPEQLENYKEIGRQMYDTVDFNDSKIIDEIAPPIAESIAYIESGINSGLLPNDMEDEEVEAMIQTFGDKWYERYGFTKEDIPDYQKNRMKLELASSPSFGEKK